MTTHKFQITYKKPETEELVVVEKEFADSTHVSAKEWAEDWAYAMADKGWFTVVEIEA